VTVHLFSADRVTIEVTDTGPGISEEASGLVFDDGFTTKPPEPDRQRGLGLALVHRLVRNSGGTIGFAPVASGGTRFTVALPVTVRPDTAVGA